MKKEEDRAAGVMERELSAIQKSGINDKEERGKKWKTGWRRGKGLQTGHRGKGRPPFQDIRKGTKGLSCPEKRREGG